MKFSIFYLSFEGSTIKIGLIVLELRNFKMWHFFGQKSEKCGKKMPSPAPIHNFFNFFFYFHKLHMKTKLCAKFQHLKMIFTEINQGGSFYPPPVNQRTQKSPLKIGLRKIGYCYVFYWQKLVESINHNHIVRQLRSLY